MYFGFDFVGVEVFGKCEGMFEIVFVIFGMGKFEVFWLYWVNFVVDC